MQSVQVQGTLYVGGGDTADNDTDYVVMTYDISPGKWTTLPPYSTRYFGMTSVDDHLVLVGGKASDGDRSKVIGVWSEDGKRWTHPYSDMTTPRSSCSAVTHEEWLIVAGGNSGGGKLLSSVEIMNTVTEQWYTGPPTLIAWEDMKTVVVDDICYFMGGYIEDGDANSVYSISLPVLVSHLFSQFISDSSVKDTPWDTQIWKELPQLPVECAAPLSTSGSLLAVGGVDEDGEAVNALHLYQPDAGKWVKVADMPTPRYACTCIMTSDDELLVAGGYRDIGTSDWLKTVDFAQIINCTF